MKEHDESPILRDDFQPFLQQYRISSPDAREIERTVENLRQYVPAKGRRLSFDSRSALLRDAAIGMSFRQASFWIISAVLYAVGFILTVRFPVDAYKTVLFLAPLPFIFNLLEALRGREEGVLEVELSCKITPQEILVSRILAAVGYNIVLNAGLSLALFLTKPAVLLGRLTFFWLLPLLLTGGVALWLCGRIKSVYAVPVTLSCWLVSAAALSVEGQAFKTLLHLNGWVVGVLLIVGLAFFAKEVRTLKKRYSLEREAMAWN